MWNKVADADVFNDSGEWFWIINQMVPLFSEPRGGMGQMFREIIRRGSECDWLCSSWASWGCMLAHFARILIWHCDATIFAVLTPLDFYRAHLCSLSLSWRSCFSAFLWSGWGIDNVAASLDFVCRTPNNTVGVWWQIMVLHLKIHTLEKSHEALQ